MLGIIAWIGAIGWALYGSGMVCGELLHRHPSVRRLRLPVEQGRLRPVRPGRRAAMTAALTPPEWCLVVVLALLACGLAWVQGRRG